MSDQRQPVFEVRGVSKHYGGVDALIDVDFKAFAGEIVGLVGDNGAGKSTLIKVIAGTHEPDVGEIFVDGERRRWKSPLDAIEAGIETLYQDSGLAPDLTIGSNVFLGRETMRRGLAGRLGFVDQRAMETEALEDLKRVGITVPPSNRTVAELSGGQRQAVAIGRAISWARKVILLDEPTNHLGARQAQEVLGVMLEAKKKGLSVIFVSHTLPHVLEVSDRIVVLRLGRVVRDAPASSFTAENLLSTITGLNEIGEPREA